MNEMRKGWSNTTGRSLRKVPGNFQSGHRKVKLITYDLLVLAAVSVMILLVFPRGSVLFSWKEAGIQFLVAAICLTISRNLMKVYSQVWRYSRTNSYLRLLMADVVGGFAYILLGYLIPTPHPTFFRMAGMVMLTTMGSMILRFMYTWLFEICTMNTRIRLFFSRSNLFTKLVNTLVYRLTGISLSKEAHGAVMLTQNKIRIAIIGAGRMGVMLAEELLGNPNAVYYPVCFVDVDKEKVGRQICGIDVLPAGAGNKERLDRLSVQEVVFAVKKSPEQRAILYDRYQSMGFKIKVYTFPVENTEETGKRQIREFDVEELLFRRETDFLGEETRNYYRDKVVLVTGGGGSIGSELSRQIARMHPKQLILLDIYENNVYDIQQEMRLAYGKNLNLAVEIASVRDAKQLDKVFRTYNPQIVLHAAAHKHVPLMEHNCSEAVKNNVFGTWNMVNAAEKYSVEKFIMISTDKAVNPTNVMGATKRLCEMIVLSRAAEQKKTSFSCTRFGNVLGSNGSVIPLFKRQIANGGPVTVTDKRIIRYFMTIPEASQLVLTSGAMAKSGELFVLDMGRPVKILDLAENMIRLSGLEPYQDIDIVETGLRPGEKLYEELLIQTETLTKTDNDMIFVERDDPLYHKEIIEKLEILRDALSQEDDDIIREVLKKVVPTYHAPEEVNAEVVETGAYGLPQSDEQKAMVMAG